MAKKVNIARQDTLEEVLNIIKTEAVYGFIEHNAILAPGTRIEYIGANKTTRLSRLQRWRVFTGRLGRFSVA